MVVDARYYITDPLSTAVWKVGSPASMYWSIKGEGEAQPQSITVDLIAGPQSKSEWVDTICEDLPATATSCTWGKVPMYLPSLPSGYGIRIRYNGVAEPDYDYSPRFQIQGTVAGSDSKLPRRPPPTTCIGICDQEAPSTADMLPPDEVEIRNRDPRNAKSSKKSKASLNDGSLTTGSTSSMSLLVSLALLATATAAAFTA